MRHPARELRLSSDSDEAASDDVDAHDGGREDDAASSASPARPTKGRTPPAPEPAAVQSIPEPIRQVIKVEEDDDEIVILDRMPTPPPAKKVAPTKAKSMIPADEPASPAGRPSAPGLFTGDVTMSPSELMPSSAAARLHNVSHDPKGKGKAGETSRDRDQSLERREQADGEEQQRIRRLEEEVQWLKAQVGKRMVDISCSSTFF